MPDKDRTSVECAWTSIYGLDGQDIISQIFSDEDLNCISEFKLEIDISDSDLEINEKCYFTFYSIPVVRTPDPLSDAVDIAKKLDFDKLRYIILNPETDKEVDYYEGDPPSIKVLFNNEKYYNMFCKAASLTDEEKKTLDTYKSQILNGEESDDEPTLFTIKDERLKVLWIHMFAAVMEKNNCYPESQVVNPDVLLPVMRLSKAFVKSYKEKYDVWEASITDNFKQLWLFNMSLDFGKHLDNVEARRLVHALFLTYYEAYSDNWKKTLFEDRLREQCNNPVNALKFANALKTQKYCREFCRAYEDYIKEKGIPSLFNTSIVVPAIPDLNTDKDESHKDWYVGIDRATKTKDGKKESIYNALYCLYEWLTGEGYIPEKTSVDLFIYRFSGYLAPKPLGHIMSWNGDKNLLAFIFKCLYTRKNGGSIIKPPYKKLSKFFTPELSNGSGLAESLENRKKMDIIKKLELFGFKNVNPSEIK